MNTNDKLLIDFRKYIKDQHQLPNAQRDKFYIPRFDSLIATAQKYSQMFGVDCEDILTILIICYSDERWYDYFQSEEYIYDSYNSYPRRSSLNSGSSRKCIEMLILENIPFSGFTQLELRNASDTLHRIPISDVSDELIYDQCADILEKTGSLLYAYTLLNVLQDIELFVICRRFGILYNRSYTLDEVGKALSLSRERIRQIETIALRKMRNANPIIHADASIIKQRLLRVKRNKRINNKYQRQMGNPRYIFSQTSQDDSPTFSTTIYRCRNDAVKTALYYKVDKHKSKPQVKTMLEQLGYTPEQIDYALRYI